MWALLALVLVLLGVFLVIAMIYIRLFGIRIAGNVIGAIKKQRQKKGKIKHTLYPVFQYTMPNGEEFTTLSSEGGTSTLGYTTGQDVELIVVPGKKYHDVYDASHYAMLVVGIGLIATGVGIMFVVGQIYSVFGMGLISLVIGVLLFLYKVIAAKKDQFKKHGNAKNHHKEFDRLEVRPIESFKSA